MMTTDSRTHRVVARAALAATASAVVLVGVAALVSGGPAAAGAAVGGLIAVGVFAFGSFAVEAVARLLPSASLLFAMVTYTFQVALMALVFVALNTSGLLDDELDRNWVGGAIILGAFVWMGVQIVLATTARIPAFETRPSTPSEGGAR
ncbi:ATP synthase protein I [Nocardioides sp. J9]|uniref:hypothetical protein n=1 Tax=unclassified Nocardioides TaxID=2615069 RepID=UPI000491AE54|nr:MULTISPECIES: hypothetical protein [unclassified Nocardioides]TWH01665.1 ATP synthase protein I [Nocardioides sp. J9]